uniref:Microfibrillar-associated protein 1 n=1 Tax=Cacopsylla melanoneura TaxID=428564 RepID=A0A8D8RWY6_9HEMI
MNSNHYNMPVGVQSTAGAVPVLNEKGEVTMKKVKVHRYVSGKRPDYAQGSSESEDEDDEVVNSRRSEFTSIPHIPFEDPRLRRLTSRRQEDAEEDRRSRHRQIHEPEVLEGSDEEEEEGSDSGQDSGDNQYSTRHQASSEEEDEDEDLSDEEIEKRRDMLRKRALEKKQQEEEEVLEKEEEKEHSAEESEEESSEYEEYTDSEEETGPRLKPVFVKKKERITIIEKEKEQAKKKQLEKDAAKRTEERKRQTIKLVEEEVRAEDAKNRIKNGEEARLEDVNTDEENDEIEYEAWKLRELKRLKRDREEREAIERERIEVERMRNMSEEERRIELRNNPKLVTNKTSKGQYKFMQKYYHRGAFYLDSEEDILKRDFSSATLDDHFDKTVLPKVMQVKNFGRSGRTKYSHLVDQDTTQFDSPWLSESSQNHKFHLNQAAGVKQVFTKPSLSKRKSKSSSSSSSRNNH